MGTMGSRERDRTNDCVWGAVGPTPTCGARTGMIEEVWGDWGGGAACSIGREVGSGPRRPGRFTWGKEKYALAPVSSEAGLGLRSLFLPSGF